MWFSWDYTWLSCYNMWLSNGVSMRSSNTSWSCNSSGIKCSCSCISSCHISGYMCWVSCKSWECWSNSYWFNNWSWTVYWSHNRLNNDWPLCWLLTLLLLVRVGDWAVPVPPPVLGDLVVFELVDVEWRCSPVFCGIVVVCGHIVALVVHILSSIVWVYMSFFWFLFALFFTWSQCNLPLVSYLLS